MDNCIFCKIVNGEIPSHKVYEDDLFVAFLDIAPATKGHVLIVPKKHASTLLELGEEESKNILLVAKKIVNALKKTFNFTDFNLIQNNGEIAGQTVHHFHLHIIPRYDKKELGLWIPRDNDPSSCEENAKMIRDNM